MVDWNAAQGFCMGSRSTTDAAYADRWNVAFAVGLVGDDGRPYPGCAGAPTSEAGPPPAPPDPADVAAAAWEQVEQLPVPILDIEPDHAVTGKKVYLQIRGSRAWSRTIDNPIGDDIVISATSDYVVDWDDPVTGARTTTRSQGGPWPNGDVTHVYTETSPQRQIRVTQRWRANWRAGTRTGALDSLSTQSAPLPIEVRELQAIRNR